MEPSGIGLDQVQVALAQEGRPRLAALGTPRPGAFPVARVMIEDRIDHFLRIHVSIALAKESQAVRASRLAFEAGRMRQFMGPQRNQVQR